MELPSFYKHHDTIGKIVISERHIVYWRHNNYISILITGIWFVFSFIFPALAPELNHYYFLDFPLGFFLASFGSLVVYVLLVGFYAWYMNRMDHRYDVAEDEEENP
ncbi:MAG: DUF4212 domain-containing protein [Magnetococcales bacterium]|nr:DUF4212 domain-containing protein [Magnetococcales bacterium]